MMSGRGDLWIALILLWLSAILLAVLTARTMGQKGNVEVGVVAGAATAAMLLGWFCLRDTWWIPLVSTASVPAFMLEHSQVALGGILGGALWLQTVLPVWRRLAILGALGVMLTWPALRTITSEPPSCLSAWNEGVCLQTDESTCSAAAAVTLLHAYGVEATETEMVDLCLTDQKGTFPAGLMRGLRSKTKGTGLEVRPGRMNIEELLEFQGFPIQLEVCLSLEVDARDPRYRQKWGWQIGQPHSVVLFGIRENGYVEIGEPAFGREFWKLEGLADLWQGWYVDLEAR